MLFVYILVHITWQYCCNYFVFTYSKIITGDVINSNYPLRPILYVLWKCWTSWNHEIRKSVLFIKIFDYHAHYHHEFRSNMILHVKKYKNFTLTLLMARTLARTMKTNNAHLVSSNVPLMEEMASIDLRLQAVGKVNCDRCVQLASPLVLVCFVPHLPSV